MERKEMTNRHWKPYMIIEYKHPRMDKGIDCVLCSINFDDEIVELQPISENYLQRSFFSAIQNISIPKRLKVATIEGKKVEDKTTTTEEKVLKNNFTNVNPTA